MKLIDKDALVAEIERIKEMYCYDTKTNASFVAEAVINSINNAINTLEVKRVDLDFMLHEYWNISPKICVDCLESATMTKDEMINFAKHFFELGLKVAQKGD